MNVLWMSPSPGVTTGYATVTRYVVKGLLKKGYNVKVLGLHQVGHPFNYNDFEFVESNNVLPLGEAGNAQDVLARYIKEFEIDVLITMLDLWQNIWDYVPRVVKASGVNWIHHVTINSTPCPAILKACMQPCDMLVAPSKFVEQSLLNVGFDRKKVIRIPHGVDTKVYKPYSEEKRQVIKTKSGYPGKFVFGSVMVNKYLQKSWPELFFAYKVFLKNTKVKNTILHSHTNPNISSGYNLQLLAEQYGIDKKIYYTEGYNKNAGFPPESMAKLYNMMDVHILATLGESFSLPVLESMACGVPNIMTDCTTCDELIKKPKTGLPAKIKASFTTPLITDQVLTDEYSLAEQMIKLYKDKDLRSELSKRAVSFAQTYDWSNIIPMWCSLLDSYKDEVLDMIKEENDD